MKRLGTLLLCIGVAVGCFIDLFAESKALMDQVCTACHAIERPLSKKKSQVDWENTVARMLTKSDYVNAEQQSEIVAFLSKVRNIDTVVHTAKDEFNLNEQEKLHLPLVNAPVSVTSGSKAIVSVQIGEELHQMLENHHIVAVDLYVNNRFAELIELGPNKEPRVEFETIIRKNSQLEVVSHCSLNGSWSITTEILAE